jgi:hypothetical protein
VGMWLPTWILCLRAGVPCVIWIARNAGTDRLLIGFSWRATTRLIAAALTYLYRPSSRRKLSRVEPIFFFHVPVPFFAGLPERIGLNLQLDRVVSRCRRDCTNARRTLFMSVW